eukprot:TRINITY_DN1423_c1_g1_i2.p1 TRINITY_DN1423_c1_g1~~TRINITY_DN1423_c1_g1_i2.p1  ORF type:complete len:675 (+),score=209.76 TRINITY_DN1423_c1_g1_i2:157-2181(+)
MGFLSEGETLDWEDSKKNIEYIKKHGIIQFLNVYKAQKERQGDGFLFGDEIEYILCVIDDEKKTVKLSLRAWEILEELHKEELKTKEQDMVYLWRPEYANYMVEGTPGNPFRETLHDLITIEDSMQKRRAKIRGMLKPGEVMITLTNFPLLGSDVTPFTQPSHPVHGPIADSDFTPDQVICPHRRFATLTKNIRDRRGSKVCVTVPRLHPIKSPSSSKTNNNHNNNNNNNSSSPPVLSPNQPHAISEASYTEKEHPEYELNRSRSQLDLIKEDPKLIYMDSMCFGMGMCCLQTTFQAPSVQWARYLYDQLAIIAPIFLSITAATPILRGYLSGCDSRWSSISAAVDDRTPEERDMNSTHYLPKSRYASISLYISDVPGSDFDKKYNDIPAPINQDAYQQLLSGGVDERLARHYAHLWTRDPLVTYKHKIEIDDNKHTDHFENIQSTNWQTTRFKPPPSSDSKIGWRVEFRPMEIQITDFENAAFVVYISIFVRAIIKYGLEFYLPISLVDENMKRSEKLNSVNTETFWWKSIESKPSVVQKLSPKQTSSSNGNTENGAKQQDKEWKERSIKEVMEEINHWVDRWVEESAGKEEEKKEVRRYLDLVKRRARGEIETNASWMRREVEKARKETKGEEGESLSAEEAWRLVKTVVQVERGQVEVTSLLGEKYQPKVK